MQAARIGMARIGEQLATHRLLDHPAGIDDRDAVGMAGDDAEIMGDQHQAEAEPLLQRAQHVQDLRLHRHVERRGRLVGDQQIGIVGDGHGDHRALAHAAGEFVRILAGPALGLRDRHQLEQFDGARHGLLAA